MCCIFSNIDRDINTVNANAYLVCVPGREGEEEREAGKGIIGDR